VKPGTAQVGSAVQHGYIETHVTRIDFGPNGWRVHASIANKSPLPVHLLSPTVPTGAQIAYPNQTMSLLVETDNGSGIKQLQPLPAREFRPALPAALKANSTWTGTFAGSDPVAHGTLFYVGFGQFQTESISEGGRPLSTSTASSAQAP
jgi:hypothetical protein